MDQLKNFFTTRTALAMIVIGILLAGLVGGVYLSQRQTQLKSKASEPTGSLSLTSNISIKRSTGYDGVSIPISNTNSNWHLFVCGNGTSCSSTGQGWTQIDAGNVNKTAQWYPPAYLSPGQYDIALFTEDNTTELSKVTLTLQDGSSSAGGETPAAPAPVTPTTPQPPPQVAGCSGSIYPATTCAFNVGWSLEEKYGPNTCNVFVRDKDGDHRISNDNTCIGATFIGKAGSRGINLVNGQTYELFVSNGDTSGNCYNQSKGKLSLSCPAAPAPPDSTTQCTPGQWDPGRCAKCAASGSWNTSGSDYGSTTEQFCACAKTYAADFQTNQAYGACPGRGGASVSDAAVCNSPVFKQNNQPVSGSLIVGQKYDVEIKVDNRDPNNPNPPTWTVGQYFLGFPTTGDTGRGSFKTNSDAVARDNVWQVNWPDPSKLRLPLSGNISAGGSNTFKFTVTPQKAGTHSFYWSMVHEAVAWFGGECTSDISVIDSQVGTPGGTTGTCPVGTAAGNLGGANRVWSCRAPSDVFGCVTTALPAQYTCSTAGQSCVACNPVCLQVITRAKNPTTGECKDFPTSCLDPGWVIDNCTLPTTPTLPGTACYLLSEKPEDLAVASCTDPNALAKGIVHSYPTDPSTTAYSIVNKDPGLKTIYVRFISKTGEVADGFAQITLSPDPKVAAIACTQSATGTGTIVALAGTNFGPHTQQGAGGVTVNGSQAQIVTWDVTNPARNLIQATVPTRLEGTLDINLKIDDGRIFTGGKCTIGTSSVQFSLTNQCSKPGEFSVDNVDAIIVQNVTGAKPLVQTKINVSKGVPQNFIPKLEANKNYSLILKAPRTLVKKVDFTTDQGTINLGNTSLFIGDIAPFSNPDGVINSFDYSEMYRQWDILSGGSKTAKTASLVEKETPGIVNTLDYSCLKLGDKKQNDVDIKSLSQ